MFRIWGRGYCIQNIYNGGDFVQGDFVRGDFVLGGILSRGISSGRFCPGGFCPGGFCPRTGSGLQSESFIYTFVY